MVCPLSFPQHNLARLERLLHVYEPLVGRTSEKKVGIAQGLDKGSVHKNIKVLQERHHAGITFRQELFPCVASVAPDGFVCLRLYPTGQFGTTGCLKERVTSGKGNVGKGVVDNDTHQFVHGDLLSPTLVPRLGIMATGATMTASRQIDACAETGSVHRGVL